MKSLLFLAAVLFALPAEPVTFDWDHSPDPTVVKYRLYWGKEANVYTASQVTLNRTNAISIADTNLMANVGYFFTVTAVNAAGIESVPSNVVGFTNIVRPLPAGTLRVNIPPGGTATATITISTVGP